MTFLRDPHMCNRCGDIEHSKPRHIFTRLRDFINAGKLDNVTAEEFAALSEQPNATVKKPPIDGTFRKMGKWLAKVFGA